MWPYEPDVIDGNLTHGEPPETASQDAENHRYAVPEQVDERSSAEIRGVLDDARVVALSMPVYKSWHENPSVEEFGIIPMPLPGSPATGGHAMCAVGYGYDSDLTGGGFFILKNSWGTDWALNSPIEPGYGLLPFEYVDQYGWEAWSIATQ
jgi:C1A family cysteine protease